MKKSANYLSFILALTLLTGCGSTGSAAAPEESSSAVTSEISEVAEEPAAEETAETSETPETPEVPETPEASASSVEEPVYDFDSDTNILVEIGDYQIEVPGIWINDYPIISPGKSDTFRMILFNNNVDPSQKLTEDELLGDQADTVISNLAKGYDEFEVLEQDTVTYSGINMLYAKISESYDNTPGTVYYYTFLNPSDGKLIAIIFMEDDGGKISLIGDVKSMLNTLKLKEE